jgi:hypothetical protein
VLLYAYGAHFFGNMVFQKMKADFLGGKTRKAACTLAVTSKYTKTELKNRTFFSEILKAETQNVTYLVTAVCYTLTINS